MIKKGLIEASHDISSGGIILSILEMCMSSKLGVNLSIKKSNFELIKYLFAEDQSRYVVEIKNENQSILEEEMKKQRIVFKKIGNTIREKLIFINDKYKFDLNNLIELNNRWFKNYSKN